MNPIVNRLLVGLVTALLAPHIEQATGIKLTDGDVEALIGLAPVAWHVIAAGWEKVCAAFVLYFPPPNASGPTAPKANP